MNKFSKYTEDINKRNCNARLSHLYKERDEISRLIDKNTLRGLSTVQLEEDYTQICEVIETLCDYRNEYDGCLIEGDLGYGLWT